MLCDFPTIAVGVPVDKMLVKGCSPLNAWVTGDCSENDHQHAIHGHK